MNKGTLVSVLVLAVIVVIVGVWYSSNRSPVEPGPPVINEPGGEGAGIITIGVVAPLTGEGASYGEEMRRGFDLVFDSEPNIRLVYEDDKLSAAEGVTAINKLITADNAKIVLGSAASSVSLAISPIAQNKQVLLFSSISTSDDLVDAGKYFFRNVPRNEIQGTTAAEYLYNTLGKTSVAIIKKNDEYATNLSSSFAARFKELGGSVVLDEAYQPSATDFRAIISKVKAKSPSSVYVPGNYEEVARLLKQSKELGLAGPFVGGDGSYSPELITIAGDAAEGSAYTLMSLKKNDYYLDFKKRFEAKYSREPDVYDAYAFEAADIVNKAIKAVGNNPDAIIDHLLSTSFDSLTGSLTFDSNGEVNRLYGIVTVVNGAFEELE